MTAFLDLKAQIKARVDVIPDDKLEDVLAYLGQFELENKSQHIMKYVEAWNGMSEHDFEEYLKAFRSDMSEKNVWRDMAKSDFEACMKVAKESGIDNYEEFKKKIRIEYIMAFAGFGEDLGNEFFDNLTANLHKNRLKETSKLIEF